MLIVSKLVYLSQVSEVMLEKSFIMSEHFWACSDILSGRFKSNFWHCKFVELATKKYVRT